MYFRYIRDIELVLNLPSKKLAQWQSGELGQVLDLVVVSWRPS